MLNNLTAIAPNMMTAVGIADAVHLVTMYYLLRPQFTDKHALVREVLKRNWLPVFLTSVTTAVGFFSLTTSEIVPMKMLGYTGGIGTIFAYLLSITVIPAILSLIPLKNDASAKDEPIAIDDENKPHWSDAITHWVLSNRHVVTAVSIGVLGLSLFGMSRVEVTSDFREMFPPEDKLISDMRWIEARLGGTGDLEIVFFGPEVEGGAEASRGRQGQIEALLIKKLTPDSDLSAEQTASLEKLQVDEAAYQKKRIAASNAFLARVDAFARKVELETKDPDSPLRVLTSFDSALQVLRKIHQVQNQNQAAYYRIPTAADVPEAAQTASLEYDDILEESLLIPAQDASSMASQYYLQYEKRSEGRAKI